MTSTEIIKHRIYEHRQQQQQQQQQRTEKSIVQGLCKTIVFCLTIAAEGCSF